MTPRKYACCMRIDASASGTPSKAYARLHMLVTDEDDGKSDKKDAAHVRAGAVTLVKMMGELREQLDATRRIHNQFNEAPKYNF